MTVDSITPDGNFLAPASRRPPYLLAEAWRDYIGEHCTRKGQEVRRVVYVARHWLRVMGADSEVATWRRADTARYETVRRTRGLKLSGADRQANWRGKRARGRTLRLRR